MTQKRSDKRRFRSLSKNSYVTAAQFMAETLIQRKAEKDNKGSLEYEYWSKSKKQAYVRQITAINKLIKRFGEDVVFDYIVNTNKNVFSASPKWVCDEISKHKVVEKTYTPKEIPELIDQPLGKPFGKKTLFSILKDIDGESNKRL